MVLDVHEEAKVFSFSQKNDVMVAEEEGQGRIRVGEGRSKNRNVPGRRKGRKGMAGDGATATKLILPFFFSFSVSNPCIIITIRSERRRSG